jgi:hypothetical protein
LRIRTNMNVLSRRTQNAIFNYFFQANKSQPTLFEAAWIIHDLLENGEHVRGIGEVAAREVYGALGLIRVQRVRCECCGQLIRYEMN